MEHIYIHANIKIIIDLLEKLSSKELASCQQKLVTNGNKNHHIMSDNLYQILN